MARACSYHWTVDRATYLQRLFRVRAVGLKHADRFCVLLKLPHDAVQNVAVAR